MKPGSRLGKDPLGRLAATASDDVLRNIMEPSAPPPLPAGQPNHALSQAGERFAKALSHLMSLAARAGLLPEEGPQDRTMLLLIRLIEALRLSPTCERVDMAAYASGVSGPWTLDFHPDLAPVPPRTALGLAMGLCALTDCLRANQNRPAGPLTLRLEKVMPDSVSLRLFGPAEAFPESLDQICGHAAADLKTLARRGVLSVRMLSSQNAREVRLDAPTSL